MALPGLDLGHTVGALSQDPCIRHHLRGPAHTPSLETCAGRIHHHESGSGPRRRRNCYAVARSACCCARSTCCYQIRRGRSHRERRPPRRSCARWPLPLPRWKVLIWLEEVNSLFKNSINSLKQRVSLTNGIRNFALTLQEMQATYPSKSSCYNLYVQSKTKSLITLESYLKFLYKIVSYTSLRECKRARCDLYTVVYRGRTNHNDMKSNH